jgi:sugar/nucleoside kinase (ribokinase family)
LDELIQLAQVLVCTVGEDGAIVHRGGHAERVPAFYADEVDPTGAGDVFATGFFIRLRETDDLIEAARFANCVASFVVEGPGTTTVPTREQVEWRLRPGRRRP